MTGAGHAAVLAERVPGLVVEREPERAIALHLVQIEPVFAGLKIDVIDVQHVVGKLRVRPVPGGSRPGVHWHSTLVLDAIVRRASVRVDDSGVVCAVRRFAPVHHYKVAERAGRPGMLNPVGPEPGGGVLIVPHAPELQVVQPCRGRTDQPHHAPVSVIRIERETVAVVVARRRGVAPGIPHRRGQSREGRVRRQELRAPDVLPVHDVVKGSDSCGLVCFGNGVVGVNQDAESVPPPTHREGAVVVDAEDTAPREAAPIGSGNLLSVSQSGDAEGRRRYRPGVLHRVVGVRAHTLARQGGCQRAVRRGRTCRIARNKGRCPAGRGHVGQVRKRGKSVLRAGPEPVLVPLDAEPAAVPRAPGERLEVLCLAPVGAPAVLGDPALLGIVPAHDDDRVSALQHARCVSVNPAGVGHEVGVDIEASADRAVGHNSPLCLLDGGEVRAGHFRIPGDMHKLRLPVRTSVGAGLIVVGRIGEAGIGRSPLVDKHVVDGPYRAAPARSTAADETRHDELLGEIGAGLPAARAGLNLHRAFRCGARGKDVAGPAAALVLDAGGPVVAVLVAPVEESRKGIIRQLHGGRSDSARIR